MGNGAAIDESDTVDQKTGLRRDSFYTYLKSQFTALIATASDFSITIFLKEIIGIWYVHAVALGAAAGALIAFLLNRNWVFNAKNKSLRVQVFRYGLVAGGSWVFNTRRCLSSD